jgi:hypothetical protein
MLYNSGMTWWYASVGRHDGPMTPNVGRVGPGLPGHFEDAPSKNVHAVMIRCQVEYGKRVVI